jgi:hypothetical protein
LTNPIGARLRITEVDTGRKLDRPGRHDMSTVLDDHQAAPARAALITRRGQELTPAETARLTSALKSIATAGYTLAAIIDPDEWRSAVLMLALGDVEVIVADTPADLPGIAFASSPVWPQSPAHQKVALPRQAARRLSH